MAEHHFRAGGRGFSCLICAAGTGGQLGPGLGLVGTEVTGGRAEAERYLRRAEPDEGQPVPWWSNLGAEGSTLGFTRDYYWD